MGIGFKVLPLQHHSGSLDSLDRNNVSSAVWPLFCLLRRYRPARSGVDSSQTQRVAQGNPSGPTPHDEARLPTPMRVPARSVKLPAHGDRRPRGSERQRILCQTSTVERPIPATAFRGPPPSPWELCKSAMEAVRGPLPVAAPSPLALEAHWRTTWPAAQRA